MGIHSCAKSLAVVALSTITIFTAAGCAAESDDAEGVGDESEAVTTVAIGADTNGATMDLDFAKNAGVGFIGRYLSFDGSHPALTGVEAARYVNAGLPLISIWEVGKQRAVETGSIQGQRAAGIADAQKAKAQATAVGGSGTPIYFTVDFNVTPDYWSGNTKDAKTGKVIERGALITAYFDGIVSVIGVHRTGAYGTYATVKGLFDAGKITYGWQQTFGGKGTHIDPRAQLRQFDIYPNQAGWGVGGAGALDMDRAVKPDFGQW